jgi:voltage-gated potassium channel
MNRTQYHTPDKALANPFTATAGAVLLVALSWEILSGVDKQLSETYLWVQAGVCLVFLGDLFVQARKSGQVWRFLSRHIVFLLLAIPYTNLFYWANFAIERYWALLLGLIPLVRAFLPLYIVVLWLANRGFNKLLTAYLFTVVLFTYLSSLVFYDYEIGVNQHLHCFGDALWWAWMNVTTVGAAIFPVTAIGKIVCVLLPIVGMIFFPIFTVYISQYYAQKK